MPVSEYLMHGFLTTEDPLGILRNQGIHSCPECRSKWDEATFESRPILEGCGHIKCGSCCVGAYLSASKNQLCIQCFQEQTKIDDTALSDPVEKNELLKVDERVESATLASMGKKQLIRERSGKRKLVRRNTVKRSLNEKCKKIVIPSDLKTIARSKNLKNFIWYKMSKNRKDVEFKGARKKSYILKKVFLARFFNSQKTNGNDISELEGKEIPKEFTSGFEKNQRMGEGLSVTTVDSEADHPFPTPPIVNEDSESPLPSSPIDLSMSTSNPLEILDLSLPLKNHEGNLQENFDTVGQKSKPQSPGDGTTRKLEEPTELVNSSESNIELKAIDLTVPKEAIDSTENCKQTTREDSSQQTTEIIDLTTTHEPEIIDLTDDLSENEVPGNVSPKRKFEEISQDFCTICLETENEISLRCTQCPKSFHEQCYFPNIHMSKDQMWQCLFCTSYQSIVNNFHGEDIPEDISSQNLQFYLKFICELYNIRESLSVRSFYDKYFREYMNVVPITLGLISRRLTLEPRIANRFRSAPQLVLSLRKMFFQAGQFYDTMKCDENKKVLMKFEEEFEKILAQYFPTLTQIIYQPPKTASGGFCKNL